MGCPYVTQFEDKTWHGFQLSLTTAGGVHWPFIAAASGQ
jgi:hypothetical protein